MLPINYAESRETAIQVEWSRLFRYGVLDVLTL